MIQICQYSRKLVESYVTLLDQTQFTNTSSVRSLTSLSLV